MMDWEQPTEADCCNSCCNPCILDVYDELKLKQPDRPPTNNCISPTSYTLFTLSKVERHTSDTFLYTFKHLKTPDSGLIYNPGQHFLVKGCHNKEYFTKAYTPIPFDNDEPHSFTILVKLYPNGRMSHYLDGLHIDDETLWRGPYGNYMLEYEYKFMLFVAQGTGVAPLYAIIHKMVHNDGCETFLKLFLCCRSENDLVLRNQLYNLTSFWNFTYEIFLSQPGEHVRSNYNEVVNEFRLTSESFTCYFGQVQVDEVRVLVCGCDAFAADVRDKLCECGISLDQIVTF